MQLIQLCKECRHVAFAFRRDAIPDQGRGIAARYHPDSPELQRTHRLNGCSDRPGNRGTAGAGYLRERAFTGRLGREFVPGDSGRLTARAIPLSSIACGLLVSVAATCL